MQEFILSHLDHSYKIWHEEDKGWGREHNICMRGGILWDADRKKYEGSITRRLVFFVCLCVGGTFVFASPEASPVGTASVTLIIRTTQFTQELVSQSCASSAHGTIHQPTGKLYISQSQQDSHRQWCKMKNNTIPAYIHLALRETHTKQEGCAFIY